jgi:hypothetical protein
MAYKFQRNAALLSGSIELGGGGAEAEISVAKQDGEKVFSADATGAVSGSGGGEFSSLKIDNVTVMTAAQQLSNVASLDGTTEATIEAAIDTLANLATAGQAGNELAMPGNIDVAQGIKIATSNFVDASRNVLANSLSSSTAIDVKESNLRISGVSVSAKAIDLNRIDGFGAAVYAEAADDVVFYDADTSTLKRESGTDFAVRLANSGLKAVSGRLLAATSSLGGISFDPGGLLGITGSHVPNVDFTGFGNSESFLRLQADGTLVQDTMEELRDEIFADVSGDATIAAGGGLTIAAGAVENSMLADDAVGADELAANAVVEASIVDNAVTLAKMAGLARGKIIYGDASGDPAALAAGANGKLLVADANGDLSWTTVSGDATLSAGALTISAGAVEHGMLAEDIISGQAALGSAAVAQADLLMLDDGPGTVKKVTFSNFEDSIFGNVSGDATVAAGGALTIANNAVENAMMADDSVGAAELIDDSVGAAAMADDAVGTAVIVDDAVTSAKIATGAVVADGIAADAVESGALNDNVISGQTELGANGLGAADELMISDGGTLKKIGVDNLFTDGPGLLSAAAVAVAADHIMFLDGGATGAAKTESITDLVAAMAGAGLSAAQGQLSVTGNNVALKADSAALVEGYNYFADASSNATVTLPASPTVGDVVVAKAGNLTSGAVININKGSADHRIDGFETIALESPFAAVTMVYVVADHWKII